MRGGGVEGFAREAVGIEDGSEVAVAFDEARGGGLEGGFGELGFDEEIAELEIDLGAIFQRVIRKRLCIASCAAFADGFQGTPGVMPKRGWAVRSTLRRLATAGARVRPLKTRGWQKMFIRRASELTAESSSRQGQSLRAGERREAVWGLERRRSQAGLAEMARSDAGWKLP